MRKHILFTLFLVALVWPSLTFVPNEQSADFSSLNLGTNQCISFYRKEPKSVDDRFFIFPKSKIPSYLVNAEFFAGLGKKGFDWIRHRDDKGKEWLVALSSLSPGVSEFLLRSPSELPFQEQLLTLMDYFQTFGLSQIRDTKMGIVMQIESGSLPNEKKSRRNFHFYRISEIERLRKEGILQKPQLSALEDYLNFVMDGYTSRRMKLSPENREKLKQISMKVRGRSHLLFMSEDNMIDYREQFGVGHIKHDADTYRKAGINPETIPTRVLPDKFNFIGGAVVVTSKSAKEPLPLELFTGFQVPRTTGVTAEIGRFFVSRVHRDPKTSYNLIGLVGSLLKASRDKQIGNVNQIVIEADAARAEIFSEYGFKSIHEQTNFEGKKEFVMVSTPEIVVENARRILLEGLAKENSRIATTLYRPKRINLIVARSFQFDPNARLGPIHTFGDSDYGALASTLFDLNHSTVDWATKANTVRKHMKNMNMEKLNAAFSRDPEGITKSLIDALMTGGMREFFKLVKELETPYMSRKEIESIYPGETVFPSLQNLDKLVSVHTSKFEKLNLIRNTVNNDINFWRYLNGDHGIHYMLLDYYLNGSPAHPPSESFQRAFRRNSGSDLNLFDAHLPEPSEALMQFTLETHNTPGFRRDRVALKIALFKIISNDPKFSETPFELIWKEFEAAALLPNEHADYDFPTYGKYIFWHNLVFASKYIEDIKFIKRDLPEHEKIDNF